MKPSVDDVLTEDHVALDALFRGIRSALGSEQGASEARSKFERRLVRHMTWEEEVLFPALQEADPRFPARKIDSLVIDHERIREKLGELGAGIAGRAWRDAAQAMDDLWVLLEGHNRDEEKGVYTDADRMLSEEERRRLLETWTSRI